MYIRRCDFKNCSSQSGGAVTLSAIESIPVTDYRGEYGIVDECNFTGCYSSTTGGGFVGNNLNTYVCLRKCNFKNCFSNNGGGGMHLASFRSINSTEYKGDYGIIDGCNFSECNSSAGGGVYGYNLNIYICTRGCCFENCITSGTGGGIFLDSVDSIESSEYKGGYGVIDECTFASCNCSTGGGGILFQFLTVYICTRRCTFENCSSQSGGGISFSAVESIQCSEYNGSYGFVDECNFTGCYSSATGGGLHATTLNTYMCCRNCTFETCWTLGYGGGLSLGSVSTIQSLDCKEEYGIVDGCTFTRCNSSYSGGGMYGVSLHICVCSRRCTFENCLTSGYGGGISLATIDSIKDSNYKGGYGIIEECYFTGCNGTSGGGGVYGTNLDISALGYALSNSVFHHAEVEE